jgi:hypothetical protein
MPSISAIIQLLRWREIWFGLVCRQCKCQAKRSVVGESGHWHAGLLEIACEPYALAALRGPPLGVSSGEMICGAAIDFAAPTEYIAGSRLCEKWYEVGSAACLWNLLRRSDAARWRVARR